MKNKDTASPTLGDLRQELYQTNQALRASRPSWGRAPAWRRPP